MVERYIVIDQRPMGFEGYFRSDELFKVIRRFLSERGYYPLERKNFEHVYEHGRQITVELRPFKQVSDYLKKELVIMIEMKRIQDKTVQIDGIKKKFMNGKVEITFTAALMTDLRAKWEGRGWLYFLRIINDKFIRKEWSTTAQEEVSKDCEDLIEEINSYLNMTRYKIEH